MTYLTRPVNDTMAEDTEFWIFINRSLARFTQEDWGDLCDEDKALNEEAKETGARFFAAYEYKDDETKKIYIISEFASEEDFKENNRTTTILFANDY